MRGIVVSRTGGPEVLEPRDLPDPEPGPGQVVVDVEAIGVNYRDIYEREGAGPYSAEPPFVAGVEGAGTVAAVGEGVSDVSPGDRVAWSNGNGSYAQRIALDADRVVPVPDGVPTEVAAAALLQGMTAHYLATTTYPVKEGETVLAHAGAGGVGLLLTQIVKLRGGRVITTTSTEEKA
ncbi:MAG: NADPH:quinone reductase, partial [Solirubrobacteraceae bacterium]|nr:NADPH:quinone reductase [Solirubrobacteraceae bacterium]